jgi:hypothetical protein
MKDLFGDSRSAKIAAAVCPLPGARSTFMEWTFMEWTISRSFMRDAKSLGNQWLGWGSLLDVVGAYRL